MLHRVQHRPLAPRQGRHVLPPCWRACLWHGKRARPVPQSRGMAVPSRAYCSPEVLGLRGTWACSVEQYTVFERIYPPQAACTHCATGGHAGAPAVCLAQSRGMASMPAAQGAPEPPDPVHCFQTCQHYIYRTKNDIQRPPACVQNYGVKLAYPIIPAKHGQSSQTHGWEASLWAARAARSARPARGAVWCEGPMGSAAPVSARLGASDAAADMESIGGGGGSSKALSANHLQDQEGDGIYSRWQAGAAGAGSSAPTVSALRRDASRGQRLGGGREQAQPATVQVLQHAVVGQGPAAPAALALRTARALVKTCEAQRGGQSKRPRRRACGVRLQSGTADMAVWMTCSCLLDICARRAQVSARTYQGRQRDARARPAGGRRGGARARRGARKLVHSTPSVQGGVVRLPLRVRQAPGPAQRARRRGSG